MSKLEQNFTINGEVVVPTGKKLGIYNIYEASQDNEDELILYFVKDNGDVVDKLTVEADYGQACGYVSEWRVG